MSAVHDLQTPSPWVVRWAPLVRADTEVLDLACGYGRHARFFAARGCRVLAVDRDAAALATLESAERVTPKQADLEGTPWPFEPESFAAVVVSNYLHRPLFAPIRGALRAGGILIYETFMRGNERFGKPSNPEFLLHPGELLEVVGSELAVVAFEQGQIETPKRALVQRICAVRAPVETVTALLDAPAGGETR